MRFPPDRPRLARRVSSAPVGRGSIQEITHTASPCHDRIYRILVSRWPNGLDDHFLDHASLRACATELERAGYPRTLPTGAIVFVGAAQYDQAVTMAVAHGVTRQELVVARIFKAAVQTQLHTARRILDSSGQVRTGRMK